MNSNNTPLVSIIIPVYNIEPYLERCVKSMIEQTYNNIELILVDDGSTDFSIANCQCLKSYKGSVIVVHKKNSGVTNTRITGARIASGEWMLFFDGDDVAEKSLIQKLFDNAIANNADISHCGVKTIDEQNKISFFYNTKVKEISC